MNIWSKLGDVVTVVPPHVCYAVRIYFIRWKGGIYHEIVKGANERCPPSKVFVWEGKREVFPGDENVIFLKIGSEKFFLDLWSPAKVGRCTNWAWFVCGGEFNSFMIDEKGNDWGNITRCQWKWWRWQILTGVSELHIRSSRGLPRWSWWRQGGFPPSGFSFSSNSNYGHFRI